MKKNSSQLPEIPDQKYFKIGEVCRLTGLPAHTLRYWETEFKQLRPGKSQTGQRLYLKKDLDLVFKIKRLRYERKYTIEGARKEISSRAEKVEAPDPALKGKVGKKERQLALGFEENLFKDKLKKTLKELRELEKQLRS